MKQQKIVSLKRARLFPQTQQGIGLYDYPFGALMVSSVAMADEVNTSPTSGNHSNRSTSSNQYQYSYHY